MLLKGQHREIFGLIFFHEWDPRFEAKMAQIVSVSEKIFENVWASVVLDMAALSCAK